jgi:hypothetical protein
MTDHQIPLARGWSLWKWFCLRGAGFPADQVLALANEAAASAADVVTEHEQQVAAARRKAREELQPILLASRGKERDVVFRALKKLEAGFVPDPPPGLQLVGLEELRECDAELRAVRALAETAFAVDQERTALALQAITRDDRFLEACLWQNQSAVRNSIERIRDGRTSRPGQQRRHEQLVARYAQRYCVKNDTIGFFGPWGWGTFCKGDDDARVRPGPTLLSQRTVYFEHWAIDALADKLSIDRELRLHVAPRRMPTLRVEGTLLHRAGAEPQQIPAQVAEVLIACDGVTPASTLVRELASHLESEPDDIVDLLEDLAERELIVWRIEVPTFLAFPERHLREELARCGPTGEPGIQALETLEAARDRVQRAAGAPYDLARALLELDSAFVSVTGTNATRRAGEAYAGRTVVYEDCQRDLEIQLGPAFVERLGEPLSLILQSARWYTATIADRFRVQIDLVYDKLMNETGSTKIAYSIFHRAIEPCLPVRGESSNLVADVTRELMERWSTLLRVPPDATRVDLRAVEIAADVSRVFEAHRPGWAGASCQELDLMIAAPSSKHMLEGATAVLGELHPAMNLAIKPLNDCPYADHLIAAYESDVPGPEAALLIPRSETSRATAWAPPGRDFDIEIGSTRSRRPRDHVLAVADLYVERVDGVLLVRARDRDLRFDATSMLGYQLMQTTTFRVLAPEAHVPRVTIDHLVIQRETWRFASGQLPFVALDRGLAQFAAVRAWARAAGIPRWAFVKVPEEPKPLYVDFASAIYVEIFVKVVREASEIVIGEMLPRVDQTWLPDGDGRSYTCELRLTAVDPVPWASAT